VFWFQLLYMSRFTFSITIGDLQAPEHTTVTN
jgi:hypothetical protein